MTPKIIELKQAPVVLVELPERPINVEDSFANGFIYTDNTGYIESFYLDDYCIDSKCLGILSDLTEEQFAECVERHDHIFNTGEVVVGYRYCPVKSEYDEPPSIPPFASKAFYSLLESEKVYTENPYGKQPTKYKGKDLPKQVRKEMYSFAMQKWNEAQSRTIDPSQTVVLLRKDGE